MNRTLNDGTRRDEAHIKARALGVMFRDLQVQGLGATISRQPTFGSLLNPLNILESIQRARHPPVREILSGFEGVVRPGQMLCMSWV
jgi:ATP-binding cassette subfamily G (WHITE) protein 2 (SNQ2)